MQVSNQEKIWGKLPERPGCRCKFCRASRSAKAAAIIQKLVHRKIFWVSSGHRGTVNSAMHQVEKKPKEKARRMSRKLHPRNQWL